MAASAERDGKTVLLIEAREARWTPERGGWAMDLGRDLAREGVRAIAVLVVPGLGGIWTDVVEGLEVLRFGHPESPCPRDFDPRDPNPRPDNLFIRHWERLAYGRKAALVVVRSGRLAGPLRQALSGQHLEWWGIVSEGDWTDWRDLPPLPRRAPRGAPARIARLLVPVAASSSQPSAVSPAPDRPELEPLDPQDVPRRIRSFLETRP